MSTLRFQMRTHIEVPAEAVYAWHARPGALERLTPPWERVVVEERTGGVEDGARVVLRVNAGPITMRWIALHVTRSPADRSATDRSEAHSDPGDIGTGSSRRASQLVNLRTTSNTLCRWGGSGVLWALPASG